MLLVVTRCQLSLVRGVSKSYQSWSVLAYFSWELAVMVDPIDLLSFAMVGLACT